MSDPFIPESTKPETSEAVERLQRACDSLEARVRGEDVSIVLRAARAALSAPPTGQNVERMREGGVASIPEDLRKASYYASEGPWEVDSEWNEDGEYGGGPNPGRGYDDFLILDKDGRSLFGSENSAAKMIEEEYDEDGGTAWDQVAKRNAAFVVASVNFVRSLIANPPAAPSVAIGDITAERARQVSAEGWSAQHDDEHRDGSLAIAAATYALGAAEPPVERSVMDEFGASGTVSRVHSLWPWDMKWFKPKNRRSDLVRAAALIIAEIERLDRMEVRRD